MARKILIMGLLKEKLQKIFGEEMGGLGGPRPTKEIIGIVGSHTVDGKNNPPCRAPKRN